MRLMISRSGQASLEECFVAPFVTSFVLPDPWMQRVAVERRLTLLISPITADIYRSVADEHKAKVNSTPAAGIQIIAHSFVESDLPVLRHLGDSKRCLNR